MTAVFKYICVAFLLLFGVEKIIGQENPRAVFVLFRHGNRTPLPHTYPNDPHKDHDYWPFGIEQLTRNGLIKAYNLGKMLRQRYDSMLGDAYFPKHLFARSTNVRRTKMSLELVLAGLFPPKGNEIWHPTLPWQPIPFKWNQIKNDRALLWIVNPVYQKAYKKYKESKEAENEYKKHQELFNTLSENTGLNVTNFEDVMRIYDALHTQRDFGLTLPKWTENVYPEKLEAVAAMSYKMKTGTQELKQYATGYFLQNLVHDLLSGFVGSSKVKLFLYSAHDINLGTLLNALDIFDGRIPSFSSCILIEAHEIRNVSGIKIYYENYSGKEPQLLKLPKCEEFCPFTTFWELAKPLYPPVSNTTKRLAIKRQEL